MKLNTNLTIFSISPEGIMAIDHMLESNFNKVIKAGTVADLFQIVAMVTLTITSVLVLIYYSLHLAEALEARRQCRRINKQRQQKQQERNELAQKTLQEQFKQFQARQQAIQQQPQMAADHVYTTVPLCASTSFSD